MSDAASGQPDRDLGERHGAALEQAARAQEQLERVAGQIADTEEYAATVLEEVAAEQPERADRLRGMAARARDFAEHEREVSSGTQAPAPPVEQDTGR